MNPTLYLVFLLFYPGGLVKRVMLTHQGRPVVVEAVTVKRGGPNPLLMGGGTSTAL